MTPAETITVWLAVPEALDSPRAVAWMERLLDPDELAACRRFRAAGDRHLYLVAHALLRTTLSIYGALPPEAWRFRRTASGRPEIVDEQQPPERLRFSLSHTRGLAACVVVPETDVGVDVERVDRVGRQIEPLEFARAHFAPEEIAELSQLPEALRAERFLELWTLKEAYVKALGLGLSQPLDAFHFLRGDAGRIRLAKYDCQAEDADTWTFALRRPTDGHQLALAVRHRSSSEPVVECRESSAGRR